MFCSICRLQSSRTACFGLAFFSEMLYSKYVCVDNETIIGDYMDCKDFERLIPDFIGEKLDFLTLERIRAHMDHCENCKEELVIQFLVSEAMQRLEEGDAFDLQGELDHRLFEAKRKVRFHKVFLRVGLCLEILVALAVIGAAVWILL